MSKLHAKTEWALFIATQCSKQVQWYVIFARDSIYAKCAYDSAIPSVRLSIRHTGGSVKNG